MNYHSYETEQGLCGISWVLLNHYRLAKTRFSVALKLFFKLFVQMSLVTVLGDKNYIYHIKILCLLLVKDLKNYFLNQLITAKDGVLHEHNFSKL